MGFAVSWLESRETCRHVHQKRDRLPRFATCVQRRPIADREKRSKSAQRPRWVRIAARMVVESASLIGSQSDLRIVDLHHRERLARSAVVADDGKVSDSDRVMFLRVSHAAPASDLEGWRWPDTSVECPGQPRVDRGFGTQFGLIPPRIRRAGRARGRRFIAPITVASWLELPIPQL